MHVVLLALLAVACPREYPGVVHESAGSACGIARQHDLDVERHRAALDLQRIIREFDANPPRHFR